MEVFELKMEEVKLDQNLAAIAVLYKKIGGDALLQKCVGDSIVNSVENQDIDVRLLDFSEKFNILFRQTQNQDFLEIGRVLRRAAHVVFRQVYKCKEGKTPDSRLLRLVQ